MGYRPFHKDALVCKFNGVSSGTDAFPRSQAAVIPKLLMCATAWTAPTVTHVPKISQAGCGQSTTPRPQSYIAVLKNPDTNNCYCNYNPVRGLTVILRQPYCSWKRLLASRHSLSCWFNKLNFRRMIWRRWWCVAEVKGKSPQAHLSLRTSSQSVATQMLIFQLSFPSLSLILSLPLCFQQS